MKFIKTSLPDAYIVEQTPFEDERGYFARSYCAKEFSDAGIEENFVQTNMSGNAKAFTLRGLHFQGTKAPEAKLVRCTSGSIYDVIVDMRATSPSYGRWFGVELSAKNRKALYVPPLFAHGYLSLEDETEILYQVSAFYEPDAECGVRFDDPSINIVWPGKPVHIIPRDLAWPKVSLTRPTSE